MYLLWASSPSALIVAIARTPFFIVPTWVVMLIVGGVLLMLPAIDLALEAIASADFRMVGATILVRISSPPLVSSTNETSFAMLLVYNTRVGTPLPCPYSAHFFVFTPIKYFNFLI